MKKTLVIMFIILILLIIYGYTEKQRRAQLVFDFKTNKQILCKDRIIQLEKGWMIHNNRFFTNGKKFYTIIFCKSIEK